MIKKTIKNISNFGSTIYSLEGLARKTKQRLILPFYHLVSDETPKHVQHLYAARSIERFKEDLDFLLKHYNSISLEELITLNKSGKAITDNCFHITFDDGLKEFYTVVAPILKERGVHATVFLNADFIDNAALFYRFKASILFDELQNDELLNLKYADKFILDGLANEHKVDFDAYLKKHQPYLTSEQIKELIGEGFTFGAHSKDHPLYKDLDFAEQLSQTQESLATIKSQFNLEYSVFSFPFTDDGVLQQLFNKISEFTDLTFGCAGIKEDSASNHLQRIPMETSESGKEIIKTEYLYCLIKQKVGKNKILRQ
ncbi:MAG: polysaccharide deacetylase family protein [Flavobacteriales bacterium]